MNNTIFSRTSLFIIIQLLMIGGSNVVLSSWITHGPYYKTIKAVAVSPQHSNILYAGAFGWGVFKSTDGGDTWLDYQNGMTNTYVRSLLVLSDSLVFAGTNDGVYKTVDGGANWVHVLVTQNSVRSLAIDPSTVSIYAGSYGSGVYKSINNGATWVQSVVRDPTTANDTLFHIWSVVVFGKDSLYAGGSILDIPSGHGGALFLSSNGGASWIQVQYPLGIRSSVHAIAISPNDPAHKLIIGTATNGVYLSTDVGINWTNIDNATSPNPSLPDLQINTVGFNSNYYYAGTDITGEFYYRSISSFASGWLTGVGLPGVHASPNSIAIDVSNRTIVYVGMDSLGFYKSTNAGVSWSAKNTNMLGTAGRSVRLNGNGMLIMGTDFGDGIWRSSDQGITWKKADSLTTSNAITSLAMTNNSSIMYAGAYGLGVEKSTNGGSTWNPTDTTTMNHFVRPVEVHPTDPNLLYAGTGNGVYKSVNGGISWVAVNTGIPASTSIRSLALDQSNPNIIYAGTDSLYLFKTTNAGANWVQENNTNGFLAQDSHIRTITINNNTPSTVYVGADSGRIYKSTNSGINWALLYNLPATHSVRKILIHPTITKVLFAATYGDGLFVSVDSGVHWSSYNIGLTDNVVYTLESDNASPLNIYAGSGQNGVFHTTYTYADRPPVLSAIGNKSVFVGHQLSFTVSATDSDLTTPSLSIHGLPAGALFNDSANGHGLFTWVPTNSAIGIKNITFLASDGTSADSEVVAVTVVDSAGAIILNLPLEAGWNMLSVPLKMNDYRKSSVYPSTVGFAFSYSGSYVAKDTLSNGVGYWIKYPSAQNVNVGGLNLGTDSLSVNGSWNMIGSLTSTISINHVQPVSPVVVQSNYFSYSNLGGYTIADSIRPGKGYWVKVNQPGTLVLNTLPEVSPTQQYNDGVFKYTDGNGTSVIEKGVITFIDGKGRQRELYVSSHSSSTELMSYELPPMPPPEVFDIRFAAHDLIAITANTSATEEFPLLFSGIEFPLTVKWDMINDHRYILRVTDNNQSYDIHMAGRGASVVKNAEVKSLVLHKESSALHNLPMTFSLEQNYPNPFNPSTIIRYHLPVTGNATLKIYNLFGQEIATLVNAHQEAGGHTVEFTPGELASGVYFYRLTSGSFSDEKKLLFVK